MKTIHYNIRNAISSKIIKNKLPQKQHKKLYTYTLPAAVIIILLIAVSLMFTNVISQNSKTDDQQKLVQLVSGGNSMANQLNRLINMPEDSVESEVNSLISDARKLISFLDRCTPAARLEEKPQNGM